MGNKKLGSFLSATAISFALSFGAVGCMVTGFRLPVDSIWMVAVFCLVLSLVTAAVAEHNTGILVLVSLSALAVFGLLLFYKEFVLSVKMLISSITTFYNMAYGWKILCQVNLSRIVYVDMGLCAVAAVTILASGWVVRQGKSPAWALAPALLTVSTCIIVTDTVPAEGYLFLTLLGLALLLLPHGVRRRNRAEGARLTALLLVPCLLLSGVLFWVVPREGYEQKGNPVQQAVLEWLQTLPFAPKQGSGMVSGVTVDLPDVGPMGNLSTKVMEVVGARDGMLYLRGQAYDVYTGTKWGVAEIEDVDNGWPKVDGGRIGSVKIRTEKVLPIRYFPYYIYRQRLKEDMFQGKITNPYDRDSYAFVQMEAMPGEEQNISLSDAIRKQCLALPADTRKETEALVKVITRGENLSILHLAEKIGNYVRDSATYSLDTDYMPADTKDFALWFLKEGDTGYCIHFASAATVLLRAAGIPARYVTGYALSALKGKAVDVTLENAHAWVEYFVPGIGWKVMEATPADGLPQAPVFPLPTEPTEPTETTMPTQTTEPTVETTVPETTTRPIVGEDPTTRPTTLPQLTKPSGNASGNTTGSSGQEGPKADRTWILRILKILAWVGGCVLLLWGQYSLRVHRKRKRMYAGPANRRALERWREVRRYARVLKLPIPEELEQLAEKAKFSQHTLTAEELRILEAWLKKARETLDCNKKKLLLRLLWALV